MSKGQMWASQAASIGTLVALGCLLSGAFLLRGSHNANDGTPNVMRVRVGSAIQATKLIKSVLPEYPPSARQAQLHGPVQLEVLLNTEGKVVHARVLSGPPALGPAAINAVKQWQYSPTLFNGKPVEVVTTVDVNFYSDSLEIAKLLSRNTWAFTNNEIAILNETPSKEMEPYIKAVINQIPGQAWIGGVLMRFKVVDLDHDGIGEIVTRIDWSGRGKALGLELFSRVNGKYDFGIVEYGSMNFKDLGNETLIVAHPPAFQLAETYPTFYYPVLYAWRDHRVVDVSSEHRDYYVEHFVPELRGLVSEAKNKRAMAKPWDERSLLIRTIGAAKAIDKVNSYFKEPVVGPNIRTPIANYLAHYDAAAIRRLDPGWQKALLAGVGEARRAMKK